MYVEESQIVTIQLKRCVSIVEIKCYPAEQVCDRPTPEAAQPLLVWLK